MPETPGNIQVFTTGYMFEKTFTVVIWVASKNIHVQICLTLTFALKQTNPFYFKFERQ